MIFVADKILVGYCCRCFALLFVVRDDGKKEQAPPPPPLPPTHGISIHLHLQGLDPSVDPIPSRIPNPQLKYEM